MVNLRPFKFFVVAFIALWFIDSCKIDDNSLNLSKRNLLLSKLNSESERNFFDFSFILNRNAYITELIKPRGDEEFVDSLFNYLLRLQISDPFAEMLIPQIGYPVWTDAIVHPQTDSLHPVITIPCVGINDSLTTGIITSFLYDGDWHSYMVSRDTLYSLYGTTVVNHANIPGYILGMIHFDEKLFAKTDTIMYNLYTSYDGHFQSNDSILLPRSCHTVNYMVCYSYPCPDITLQNPEGQIHTRRECTDCDSFDSFVGCSDISGGGGGNSTDVGVPIGGGHGGGSGGTGGGGGGGTGGGTGSGSGSGGSSWAPCGVSLNLIPLLCSGNATFVGIYNTMINYLTSINAATWLLNNTNNSSVILNTYWDFIKHHSSDKQLNAKLLQTWIHYFQVSNASPKLNLTQISALLEPYYNAMSLPEQRWVDAHPAIYDEIEVEYFLEALAQPNVSITDFEQYYEPYPLTGYDWEGISNEVNWFYGTVEGQDWIFDEEYWADPNLYFPLQDRPTYSNFADKFKVIMDLSKSLSKTALYETLGGQLYTTRIADVNSGQFLTDNICALSISYALNHCDISIPDIPATLKDKDGNFYFLNVLALDIWLKQTFGTTEGPTYIHKVSPQNDPINSDSFGVETNRGIYTMIAENPGIFGAKGHADLFNGVRCVGNRCFWGQGKEYNLWILP